eukprot:COSAG05_NODE_477_length_9434_cov_1.772319_8_plen_384_part_00
MPAGRNPASRLAVARCPIMEWKDVKKGMAKGVSKTATASIASIEKVGMASMEAKDKYNETFNADPALKKKAKKKAKTPDQDARAAMKARAAAASARANQNTEYAAPKATASSGGKTSNKGLIIGAKAKAKAKAASDTLAATAGVTKSTQDMAATKAKCHKPVPEAVPPLSVTRKAIVLSCPELGSLDPHGNPNAESGKYDSAVMSTVIELQKRSGGVIKMGFDRAGTSTSDERDKEIWDQLNPEMTEVYKHDEDARKQLVKQTIWFAGYKAAAKAQMRLESQAFDGTLEVLCIYGGLVTQVEQEEMLTIIEEAKADAKMSGVECHVVRKDMSFHAFVCEYGTPYGISVGTLLKEQRHTKRVSGDEPLASRARAAIRMISRQGS